MFGQLPQKARDVKKSNPQPTISSDSAGSVTKGSLIPNPSFQHEFDIEFFKPRIACLEQGLAWSRTSYGWEGTILDLVDRDGVPKDSIDTIIKFNGMTVTLHGDLLLADNENCCIKLISRQKTITTLFKTGWTPHSVCCLHNGDIVVNFGGDKKVIVYSRIGQIKETMDHIDFTFPMAVSANKVNQDIYICDKENFCRDSAGKVIAVGADGKLRYEYTGQGDSLFTPVEMCTDQMGHILITDYSNDRVHILDQEGQFIQYILTSHDGLQYRLETISVDNKGFVWVGAFINYMGYVKSAKYLKNL